MMHPAYLRFFALALLLPGAACSTPAGSPEAAATSAKPATAAVLQTPLVQERGYALVPVRMGDGEPFWFVLDSAASSSVISPATRDRLGLGAGAVQAQVAGGSGSATYQGVELPPFDFGGVRFEKLGAVVVDLSRFQAPASGRTFAGIIGNDVLRRFDFAVDMPRSILRLRPRGSGPAASLLDAPTCVPNVADDDGWIALDLRVNGAPVRAVVDTGAGRSIFNWTAARAAGVTPQTPGVTKAQVGAQGLGSSAATDTSVYKFDRVQAGPVTFAPVDSRIADLPVFETLGLGQRSAVIFGTNYLADRAMAVSYPDRQVCFSGAQPAKRPGDRSR